MTEKFIYFEGKPLPESYVKAIMAGEQPPIRDWEEKPTMLQRIMSAITLVSGKADWVHGPDLSRYQGVWNIQKTIDMGARYAFIKATQNNFTDSKFDANANIAANASFPIGVYHFGDPYGVSAIQQAQYFCNVVDGVGELSAVLDMEWKDGLSPSGLLQWMLDFWGEASVHLGDRLKEIYTRISWFDPNVAPHDWEADGIGLWVARWASWLEGPWSDGNYVPRDWSDWINWQYSSKGNGFGYAYGVESADIDLNYFHGDWDAFLAHYMPEPEPEPEPDPEIEALKQRVTALENWQSNTMLWQTNVEDWMEIKNAKDNEQDARLDALEEGETIPEDAMYVEAIQLSHYWSSVDRDHACEKEPPPANDPRGKMVLQKNEGRIEDGQKVLVFKKAYDNCKDNPNDPLIKASGGDYYYRSYQHPDWYIPKDEVILVL